MSPHLTRALTDVGVLLAGIAVFVAMMVISIRRTNKKALRGPPVRDRVSALARDSRSQGGRPVSGGGMSAGGGNGRSPNGRGSGNGRSGRGLLARRGDRPVVLPVDATVSFADERAAAGIDEIFAGLERDLVGLVPVKQKVQQIAALLLVDQARQKFGLVAPRPNLHMCFTGPPGTGKTTVALRMAELLHRLGYVETGQLVHAMRDDLVGEYIGQTAPKTKRVLEKAMGGVLFIDEAYYLYRDKDSKDYGQEAVDILLQVMENNRDQLVVILAGYKDRMDTFFTSNPGMSSRIAHHLDFAAYQVAELVAIGKLMLSQARYYLSPQGEAAFRHYLASQISQPRFANARAVRNELERARLRHAHRLASDPHRPWTRDDLMRIEPADILTPGSYALPGAASPEPALGASDRPGE